MYMCRFVCLCAAEMCKCRISLVCLVCQWVCFSPGIHPTGARGPSRACVARLDMLGTVDQLLPRVLHHIR